MLRSTCIRSWLIALGLSALVLGGVALGQGRGWWNRVPPRFAQPNAPSNDLFTFCRILYESVRAERSGYGWNTDYPYSDINFMTRFSQLTSGSIRRDGDGSPEHVVVTLLDDTIFEYPFAFMSDVGTVGFSPSEVERLRDYLMRGGVLYVDDFWGEAAWEHWKREIHKVLPPNDYPIVDVPLDHVVFRTFYTIRKIPQIPSIHYWRRSGGRGTSERGFETAEPHFRGIFDDNGRLMVLMTPQHGHRGWLGARSGRRRVFLSLFAEGVPGRHQHRALRDDALTPSKQHTIPKGDHTCALLSLETHVVHARLA